MKVLIIASSLSFCCCFAPRIKAEPLTLLNGRNIAAQSGSTLLVSDTHSAPQHIATLAQNRTVQSPYQVVIPPAPSAAQLQGLLGTETQKSNPGNNPLVPRLTADDRSQLVSARDTAYFLLQDLSPTLKMGNNLRRTYDAVNTLLKPVPADSPGQPLAQLAALMELSQIWRPESAINSVDPNQYSDVLRLVANSLNGISANIDKRNKTYGYMINGIDDRKIFIATLLDSKAVSAAAIPDSLVTRDVIQWYVDNSTQFRVIIGEGPSIRKNSFFGDAVDRGELKTWCYNNRAALKYYTYGKAILPDNLSYFAER